MSREEQISKLEFEIVYAVFGLLLLFQYSDEFTNEEMLLFVMLVLAYYWTAGLFVHAKVSYGLNIFEPITIITVLYEGIFVLKPIVDLRTNNMLEHGISVIGGGAKATALFVLGYTVFWLSYYMAHGRVQHYAKPTAAEKNENSSLKENNLIALCLAWAVVYALCIYCMLTQGLSLKYIFSFGEEGSRVTDDSNTALLFLSNFGITLIGLWLMILEYSKSRFIKIATTALCAIYILMRNARWLMLVFIVAPITLSYLKRKKQPRLLWVVLIAIAGLTIFAWMQVNRPTLASGGAIQGWGSDGFSLEVLLGPLESDLSTYRTFYSMVERYPSEYSYLLGQTFLYAFILFIPRAIWPGKPDNPVRDMIEHSLNRRARMSGTAVANVGEFYANFGVVGILVFMYLFGWITSELKRSVFQDGVSAEEGADKQIAYAILFPLLFQWVARGNFSGNLYLTLFAILPFIVNKTKRASDAKRDRK